MRCEPGEGPATVRDALHRVVNGPITVPARSDQRQPGRRFRCGGLVTQNCFPTA